MEIKERAGGSNSVVESQPSKLLVAGSIPVSRSKSSTSGSQVLVVGGSSASLRRFTWSVRRADVAQR